MPDFKNTNPDIGRPAPAAGGEGSGGHSAHARYAQLTVGKLGLSFIALDADGYLFEISDGARRASFSAGAGTPYALNAAHAAAIARDKGFAQAVLARAGLPTIPSRLFFITEEHANLRDPGREPADALAFAAHADYPVFCKPIDGSQGAFAEIIADAAQFERYMGRAGAKHYAILVQPVIEAREYRVFVLNGRALFAYEKQRAGVTGDGASSLAALTPQGGETMEARDAKGRVCRSDDIPPAGATLFLSGPRNRAAGGSASGFTTDVEPEKAEIALRCCAALGLKLAAVDLFEGGDLGEGRVILEVNSNPAIKTLEDFGRWDLIETIWRANIEAAFAGPQ